MPPPSDSVTLKEPSTLALVTILKGPEPEISDTLRDIEVRAPYMLKMYYF